MSYFVNQENSFFIFDFCRTCSDPEVDSTNDKKLDVNMYENNTDGEESEDNSYMENIEVDKASLLSI